MTRQKFNRILSEVSQSAKALYHSTKNNFNTWKSAMIAAWKRFKLRQALKKGLVSITFKKKDGTTTTRIGTLNAEISGYTPKGTGKPRPANQIYFWDTSKNGISSLLLSRLIVFQIPA